MAAALALGAVATFLLETLRHSSDMRRSLFQVGMTLAGVLYVGFPSGLLVACARCPTAIWILLILCVTWGTDSFAYIGGQAVGQNQARAHDFAQKDARRRGWSA